RRFSDRSKTNWVHSGAPHAECMSILESAVQAQLGPSLFAQLFGQAWPRRDVYSVGETWRMDLLVRLGARDLDDALPLRDVVNDIAAKLLRIHFHRDRALSGPIVAHLR